MRKKMTEKFQTVRGMRDFLPEQMRLKQWIEDTCRRVFESYGFEPLQTPVVEDFGLLTKKGSGGEAIKEEIYYFKDKGERELGLRFDFTVPLGRVVASNPTLPKPFRRYQIGPVYRYGRPQAKRYREFTQADADILGVAGIKADFECISIACEIMQELGLNFFIVLNSRPLLEEIALACQVPNEKVADCFRCIDKLDKIGESGVKEELEKIGIAPKILDVLKSNDLEKVKSLLKNPEPAEKMQELLELVKQNGLQSFVRLDLSIARGLDYYTGTVFEVKVESGPSVGGGGRYDKLVELYGGQKTPAVGFSFGIDRLLDTLENTKKIPPKAQVLIMALSENQVSAVFKTAQSLRKTGINVEVDLLLRGVSKNAEAAKKKGVRFLVLIGENEQKKGIMTIKDLNENSQFELKNNPESVLELKRRL